MWSTSKASLYWYAIFIALTTTVQEVTLQYIDMFMSISPRNTTGLTFKLDHKGERKLDGILGVGRDFTNFSCVIQDDKPQTDCTSDDVILSTIRLNTGFQLIWEYTTDSIVYQDCYDLKVGELNWYGGPERNYQKWPLEKLDIGGDEAYVIKNSDNFAVAERYWLNSKGIYIFVDETVPLFVNQNIAEQGKVCFVADLSGPYVNRERVRFNYTIVYQEDPKKAHLHAVKKFLGKPKGYPDERMIKYPIWTTWAKYKKDINDEIVTSFAQDILDHGYEGGQIEIDDAWEACYGNQVFNTDKFGNISTTVGKLKEQGFRVTLWIHPFVNNNCEDVADEGREKGYFVRDADGNTKAKWWNGDDANQIDFTNSDAVEWFSARLKKLQENPGIDSFKFDAGEVNYGPQPAVYDNVDPDTIPNVLTESYVRACAKFGNLIEVRSAWRTQDLPVFVRMIDKDSVWGENNGLYTLVTTLLQMNMNGYSMVLPDMIGGNGYGAPPTLELIIRWTQANTFMPAMQFSYLPWDYASDDYDGAEIVKKFIDLHEQYSDAIIAAMKANIENGTPVNAPIWWVDPLNRRALATDDEFLLGEDILVAPILVEGATSRDVYLPAGLWKDGNSDRVFRGPLIVGQYDAPIDILPYFLRQSENSTNY